MRLIFSNAEAKVPLHAHSDFQHVAIHHSNPRRPQRDRLRESALRQQLTILKREQPRPKFRHRDRLFWIALMKTWKRWRTALVLGEFVILPEHGQNAGVRPAPDSLYRRPAGGDKWYTIVAPKPERTRTGIHAERHYAIRYPRRHDSTRTCFLVCQMSPQLLDGSLTEAI